jgi:hypothetical protein
MTKIETERKSDRRSEGSRRRGIMAFGKIFGRNMSAFREASKKRDAYKQTTQGSCYRATNAIPLYSLT